MSGRQTNEFNRECAICFGFSKWSCGLMTSTEWVKKRNWKNNRDIFSLLQSRPQSFSVPFNRCRVRSVSTGIENTPFLVSSKAWFLVTKNAVKNSKSGYIWYPPLLTILSLSHINWLLFHFSTVPKERQFTLLKSSSCIVVAVAICPEESGITIVMAP